MDISKRVVGDVSVLDVAGKVTLTDCNGRLKDAVTGLLSDGQKKIVVNLAAVSYMDSSGLGETVACHTTAKNGGGAIKLVTQSKVKDLIVMTKLTMVFDSYDKVDDAIAAFK